MKQIGALFFSAMMFIATGAQAQVVDAERAAVSSTTELIQKTGDMRSSAAFQADCAAGLALDSCAKPVTPTGCPAGQHWTMIGSGIAHCVNDDPVCVSPQILKHDALGNPFCHTPIVTHEYRTRTTSCVAPQIGTRSQSRRYTYTDGVLTRVGSWTTTWSDCEDPAPPPPPPPPPTCSNGASDYPTCTPPYTPPVTSTCPNGASNYPTCTFPPVIGDPPAVPPSCSAADVVVNSTPCGAGMAGGPIEQHQTVSCPGSIVGGYTTGSCTPAVCANGAKNWPTCTIEAPVVQCRAGFKWCVSTREKSDDPRDDWFSYGQTEYVGPDCKPERYLHGETTTWDGGCPADYTEAYP